MTLDLVLLAAFIGVGVIGRRTDRVPYAALIVAILLYIAYVYFSG